jgi:hypothetical protein
LAPLGAAVAVGAGRGIVVAAGTLAVAVVVTAPWTRFVGMIGVLACPPQLTVETIKAVKSKMLSSPCVFIIILLLPFKFNTNKPAENLRCFNDDEHEGGLVPRGRRRAIASRV